MFLDEIIENIPKVKMSKRHLREVDKKYIHNNHFYEFPRKKYHEDIEIQTFNGFIFKIF